MATLFPSLMKGARMRTLILFSLLSTVGIAAFAEEPSIDALFEKWADTQGELKSLSIEFSYAIRSDSWKKTEHFAGQLRVIRDAEGKLRVAGEMKNLDERQKDLNFLFVGQCVYWLHPDEKLAWRIQDYRSPDIALVLAPFVGKAEIGEHYDIVASKQDDKYTYFKVTPKKRDRYCEWVCVGVTRESAPDLPPNIPQVMWHRTSYEETMYVQVKTWKLNDPKFIPADEFVLPEDRPGWEIGPRKLLPPSDGKPHANNIVDVFFDLLWNLPPLPPDAVADPEP
jgi:hypothetical protein